MSERPRWLTEAARSGPAVAQAPGRPGRPGRPGGRGDQPGSGAIPARPTVRTAAPQGRAPVAPTLPGPVPAARRGGTAAALDCVAAASAWSSLLGARGLAGRVQLGARGAQRRR